MKPNEQQKRICDLIKSQASFWQSTNDIHSPTHYEDIETEIDNIEDLNENEKCQLIYIMQTMYDFVKVIGND